MDTTATETATPARRTRVPHAKLIGLVAFVAIFSTGCTLSDVSALLSILRLFGIL